jgi:hypothetical protein
LDIQILAIDPVALDANQVLKIVPLPFGNVPSFLTPKQLGKQNVFRGNHVHGERFASHDFGCL